MKVNLTNALSCAVFGHNLFRSPTQNFKNTELVCSTCNEKIHTNSNGDFNDSPISNTKVKTLIRQHFLLKKKSKLLTIS